MRLLRRVGIIPDGNRRRAKGQGAGKSEGYVHGISSGVSLYRMHRELGIDETSSHGFTTDNIKRPSIQRQAFTRACMTAVEELVEEDASLLVLGNTESPMFLQEPFPFTARYDFGKGGMKISFLVNYSWEWDLGYKDRAIGSGLRTSEASRIDLIIRWGGRQRLLGSLPVQSVYSDFYVVGDYWLDFRGEHVEDALKWYVAQNITLGG